MLRTTVYRRIVYIETRVAPQLYVFIWHSYRFQAFVPVWRRESAHVYRSCHSVGFSHGSSDQPISEVHRCCEFRDEATSAATTAYPLAGNSVSHGLVHVQRDFNQPAGMLRRDFWTFRRIFACPVKNYLGSNHGFFFCKYIDFCHWILIHFLHKKIDNRRTIQ